MSSSLTPVTRPNGSPIDYPAHLLISVPGDRVISLSELHSLYDEKLKRVRGENAIEIDARSNSTQNVLIVMRYIADVSSAESGATRQMGEWRDCTCTIVVSDVSAFKMLRDALRRAVIPIHTALYVESGRDSDMEYAADFQPNFQSLIFDDTSDDVDSMNDATTVELAQDDADDMTVADRLSDIASVSVVHHRTDQSAQDRELKRTRNETEYLDLDVMSQHTSAAAGQNTSSSSATGASPLPALSAFLSSALQQPIQSRNRVLNVSWDVNGVSVAGTIDKHVQTFWPNANFARNLVAQIAASGGRPVVQPVNLGIFDYDGGGVHVFLPLYNGAIGTLPLNPSTYREIQSQIINGLFTPPTPSVAHRGLVASTIQHFSGNVRITGFEDSLFYPEDCYLYPPDMDPRPRKGVDQRQYNLGLDELEWHRDDDSEDINQVKAIYRQTGTDGRPFSPMLKDVMSFIWSFGKLVGANVSDPRSLTVATMSNLIRNAHTVPFEHEQIAFNDTNKLVVSDTVVAVNKPVVYVTRDVHGQAFAHELAVMASLRTVRGFQIAIGFACSSTEAYMMYEARYIPIQETSFESEQDKLNVLDDVSRAAMHIRGLGGSVARNREFGHMFATLQYEERHCIHANITPDTIFWDVKTQCAVLGGLDSVVALVCDPVESSYNVVTKGDSLTKTETHYRSPALQAAFLRNNQTTDEHIKSIDFYSIGCLAFDLYFGFGWTEQHLRLGDINETTRPDSPSTLSSESVISSTGPLFERLYRVDPPKGALRTMYRNGSPKQIDASEASMWRWYTTGVLGTLPGLNVLYRNKRPYAKGEYVAFHKDGSLPFKF